MRKARWVARSRPPSSWVLAADTAVLVDGEVLGKPRDREEAAAMLRALSGRTHRVVTAVAFAGPSFERTLSVTTEVDFRVLGDLEIRWYTSLEEPYDKAGGYAIQGRGAFLVTAIRGSYTGVVGLPMAETVTLLEEAGLSPWPGETAPRSSHG